MATAKCSSLPTEVPKIPYVYALIDPRTELPFYIGKGRNRRMFQHAYNAARGRHDGSTAKSERIREILAVGLSVGYRVLGEYETDDEAYEAEKEFIADFDGLLNVTAGGGGMMPPKMYFQRRAKRMLDRLVPFDEWNAWLQLELRDGIEKVWGRQRRCISGYSIFSGGSLRILARTR